jgi:hypothetical protein
MAGSPAPDTPLVAVRENETKAVLFVTPLDAKEYVASGAYALAPDVASPAAPRAAQRTAHSDNKVALEELNDDGTVKQVVHAYAIDATEMLAKGPYRVPALQPLDAPTEDAAQTDTPLPPIDQLSTVLAAVTDADVLMNMEARDARDEAKSFYEHRFTELANAAARQ